MVAGLLACLLAPALETQQKLVYETTDADAAVIYLGLGEEFNQVPEVLREYALGSAVDQHVIRKALVPFEKGITRLHEAARARRCHWSYPDRDKVGARPAHVARGISAARLLAARCRLRIEGRDLNGALDDAIAAWRLGFDFLSDGPLLANLAGWIALILQNGVLLRSLSDEDLNAAQLILLAEHAEHLAPCFPLFQKAMEFEGAQWIRAIEDALADFRGLIARVGGTEKPGGDDPVRAFQELLKMDPEGSRKALRKQFDEHWEQVLKEAREPIHTPSKGIDREEMKTRSAKAWERYEASGDRRAGLEAAAGLFTLLSYPGYPKVKSQFAMGRFGFQLHALSFRLELHRREHGRYPASIEGLPDTPIDPWDGKPAKYVLIEMKTRSGFVLTSAGPGNDWKERMNLLDETCQFHVRSFEDQSESALESVHWTALRIHRR